MKTCERCGSDTMVAQSKAQLRELAPGIAIEMGRRRRKCLNCELKYWT